MTFDKAISNFFTLNIPTLIFCGWQVWRRRVGLNALRLRLGLQVGLRRHYLYAIGIAAALELAIHLNQVFLEGPPQVSKGAMNAFAFGAHPSTSLFVSIALYAVLATSLPEEIVFRGLFAETLFRRLSFRRANLIQTLVFVVPHLAILYFFFPMHRWPFAVLLITVLTAALGWLRMRSRSVWPCVVLHAVGNVAGCLRVMDWS